MRVLIACEFSGVVREAFRTKGHDAWSCDLLPTEISGQHIQDDVLRHLGDGWDMMIAHPPCTYLSRAAAHLWKTREAEAISAAAFVLQLYNAPISKVAIENPVGRLNKLWRYPDQVIQPSYFGEHYKKATCLWLKNLPPLMATYIDPDPMCYVNSSNAIRQRVANGPAHNQKDRSRTFKGIGQAMAEQWG